jgi:tRNA-specific 2-thiouridylase
MSQRVVVGLSGGVDSAVAALLLKRAGYDVVGLFMKNWEDDDHDAYCSTRQDLIDAVSVAEVIGIDIDVVNFAAEYRERVFADFLREYAAGRTPNPDVLCNAEIKFKAFLDHAMRLGAEYMATGHYAQVHPVITHTGAAPIYQLLRGADSSKDQSYFLHRLNQAQLSRTLFPVGHLLKSEVRRLADAAGLPNASKKDSTGICFIGERPFREFLNRYLPHAPGPIKTLDGRVVGEHVGLAFYTIGQRKGVGVGGVKGRAEGAAWYVVGKDIDSNTLRVVQGHDDVHLLHQQLSATQASWIAGEPPRQDQPYTAKSRYRQRDSSCRFGVLEDQNFALNFETPHWAVTPGQSAVLYDGAVCLGGGVITSAL